MQKAQGLEIDKIYLSDSDNTFGITKKYLQTRVEYIFEADRLNKNNQWLISTWSNRVQPSSISKNGSDQDMRLLKEKKVTTNTRVYHKHQNSLGKWVKRRRVTKETKITRWMSTELSEDPDKIILQMKIM